MINKETTYSFENDFCMVFKKDQLVIKLRGGIYSFNGDERFELLRILNSELSSLEKEDKDHIKNTKLDSNIPKQCTASNNGLNGKPMYCEDCCGYRYSPKYNMHTMCKSGGMYCNTKTKFFNVESLNDDYTSFSVTFCDIKHKVNFVDNGKDYSVIIDGVDYCKVTKYFDSCYGESINKGNTKLSWCACNASTEDLWKEAAYTLTLEHLTSSK